MFRSPCRKYILCRLLDGASVDELRGELAERQLDVLPADYFEQLQSHVVVPTGFDPRNRSHLASQRFLVAQGVRLYFCPDVDMNAAVALLERPLEREFLETLVTSGADNAWLAHALERRGTPVSQRALRLYCQFYFDITTLDQSELSAFLARRRGEDADDGVEDPRVRAARGRETGVALLMEMLRSGQLPSGIQLSRLLEAARMASAAGAVDATLRGDAQRALAFSGVLRNLSEVLVQLGDPGRDLQDELHSLMLATDGSRVPHVSELAGSGYTVDLLGAVRDSEGEPS